MQRLVVLVLVAVVLPGLASAQTFPLVRGALEFEVGVGASVIPEDTPGTTSAQPLIRVGYFVVEGLEAQGEASYRVYPLGSVSPKSLNVSGNLLWYPNLGVDSRNLYLLGGAGVASKESSQGDSSTDPFGRAGVGYKVPLAGVGLQAFHFTMEFRGEWHFEENVNFVSGALIALSYFM